MNYLKRIETTIIAVVILVLGAAYGFLSDKAEAPTTDNAAQQVQQQQSSSAPVRYQGQEGRTALDILRATHDVETQNFAGVGDFVKKIDGVEADSSHFWSFYVNGAQATEGAGTFITKSSDSIEWKLEEIR